MAEYGDRAERRASAAMTLLYGSQKDTGARFQPHVEAKCLTLLNSRIRQEIDAFKRQH